MTFKLGGNAELPSPLDYFVVESPKAPLAGDAETWQVGMQRFAENCQFCHGAYAISSGVIPDLEMVGNFQQARTRGRPWFVMAR